MRKCQDHAIQDQLPDYVHGTLDELAMRRIQTHLAQCSDCEAEADLLRAILASSAHVQLSDATVARIALAIPPAEPLERLVVATGDGPFVTRRRRMFTTSYLQIAAAFLVAAVGVSGIAYMQRSTPVAPAIVAVAPNVTDTPGTETILPPSSAAPVTVPVNVVSRQGVSLLSVSELSDEHLARLLESMQELDAVPPTDPESALPLQVPLGGVL